MNIEEIANFLDTFMQKMQKTGIDVSKYNLDHVAYQASSASEYEKFKNDVSTLADLKHEAVVHGRRVGVFQLKDRIEYRGNNIVALEVIEPKTGQVVKAGWEHAEFVINESFSELMAKYPNLTWDTSSVNTPIYSHLKLKLTDSMQVKFHHMDILETIKLDRH